MLVDFVLDWDKLNKVAEERGFVSEYIGYPEDKPEHQLLRTRYNLDHPFIKEHNITEHCSIPHCIRQTTGIYWSHDLEHVLDEMSTTPCIDAYLDFNLKTGEYMTRDEMRRQFDLGWERLEAEVPEDKQWQHFQAKAYGVADNIQQILQYFHAVIGNPNNKVLIAIRELKREDQHESGGWRWHKNGKYIGTKKPQHEYFYDDTHIDKIMPFHVYCV